MKLAKPLVLSAFALTLLTLLVVLYRVAESSDERDRADAVLLFRDHSYRSEADLRACLLDQRRDGLVLAVPRRGPFGILRDEMINQARHTTVTIENRGDFRIIRAWRRGETTLRPGENQHLLQCLGRPAG